MNRTLLICMVMGVLFLNSCLVSKKVVYVKDMKVDSLYMSTPQPMLEVQKGDRLNIVVRAKLAELAAPFNLEMGNYDVETKVTQGAQKSIKNYLVDRQGQIDFPVLGKIDVEGLTLQQVKERIYQNIVHKNLINEPLVQVDLVNLRVNVLGEVTRQQLIDVPEGRITLLDAVAQAGGLTVNGAADKVFVIREVAGKRTLILNDLESTSLFESPGYYLQQNDIVYVQPRSAQTTPREQMGLRYTSLGLSIVSVALTLLTFLK